jgi:hypothetical protein
LLILIHFWLKNLCDFHWVHAPVRVLGYGDVAAAAGEKRSVSFNDR